MPFLRTERLAFRVWSPADLPLALALWGDPVVTRLIGGPFDEAAVRHRLAAEIDLQAAHGYQYWPVFRRDDETHVGCAGLHPRDPDAGVAEFGFHIVAAAQGRGYATEAAHAVIDHAFETLGLSALFAGHHPGNTRSRGLLEKLGFRYTHDERYPPTGLDHPSYRLEPADR